jgi:leucyl aminopeptidase
LIVGGPSAVLPTQVSPPEFALSDRWPESMPQTEVWALPVLPAESGGDILLGPGADQAGAALGLDLLGYLESARATGRAGELTTVPVPLGGTDHASLRTVLLVGIGDGSPAAMRRAGAALTRAVKDCDTVASTVTAATDDEGLTAFVVSMMLGAFSLHLRKDGPSWRPVARVVLAGQDTSAGQRRLLDRAMALGGAGWRSRMLAQVPSNIKNPGWLAEQATVLAEEAGLKIKVWDEKALAKDGFGGILAVGKGSETPPRLIRLSYTPAKGVKKSQKSVQKSMPHVVLVGKGITFDTGGLSIKPAEGMVNMKRDMTGGAVVMAVMGALADLEVPVRVTGLVPAAENAVSGSSMRPGDVIRHYGGRTTEVTNTDAEGRLVLADALAYAAGELDPTVIIDVATLTGAMRVALGTRTGGFFANRERLADNLRQASVAAGEPLWRFPLAADYESNLAKSQVADADNAPGGPGAIVAALFLQHFVDGLPWAHLDIASVGDSPADVDEWTQGPTGFGPRALLTWLADPSTAGVV